VQSPQISGSSPTNSKPPCGCMSEGKHSSCHEEAPMKEQTVPDNTEDVRRELVREINAHPRSRANLEGAYGQVWDTAELSADFNAIGFAAPFVVVIRKSDGIKGSLQFQHSPRLYYAFEPAT
jgi:hypothetical protein